MNVELGEQMNTARFPVFNLAAIDLLMSAVYMCLHRLMKWMLRK